MADDRRAAARTLEKEALAVPDDGPTSLSAVEAARRLGDGALTSEQLVGACLERIEKAEPEVQAWAHLDPEHALEQARRLDAFFAGREPGDRVA